MRRIGSRFSGVRSADSGNQVARGKPVPVAGEQEIRQALLRKRLSALGRRPDTLIVNELGLAHARSRIDVAVINGEIHGFEIKSSQDGLGRLSDQLAVYGQSLQKLTLVVAPRHVDRIMEMVPQWCGVLKILVGRRRGLTFESIRRPSRNPELDRFVLSHLLWREEVQGILADRGIRGSALRAPRKDLYRKLVDLVSEPELIALIKAAMMQRRTWRDHPRLQ